MSRARKNVGIFFVIKIVLLIAAFVVSVYTIYFMNTRGIEKTPLGALIQANYMHAELSEEKWDLCSKELVALSFNDVLGEKSWKLLRAQNHWQLLMSSGERIEISEKDFDLCQKAICRVSVSPLEINDLKEFNDYLSYLFTDSSQTILRLNINTGEIFWNGRLFNAQKLIDYLIKLPDHQCK